MNLILRTTSKLFCLMLLISITSAAILPVRGAISPKAKTVMQPAFTSDAVVREWNQIAFTLIPAAPPFPANRSMAMVQVAVFEAVNAVTGLYQPYLGAVNPPSNASPEAAAVMAAYGVLVNLLPAQSAVLAQRRDASLALIPDGQAKIDGMAAGTAAANAVIANRTNDGSSPGTFYLPTNSNPYEWQVYGGCSAAGGAFFNWQNVKPFAILSASQFRAQPPPLLGSSVYVQDLNETKTVGDINSVVRPQDRTDVARLYAVANPPALWNSILLQILSTRNDEITFTARAMALMNMAASDAAVSVFDSKYFYRTWRPLTAIPWSNPGQRGMPTGTFTPLIATPCFPGYPSAHGSLSSAALQVLERTYGRFGYSVTVQHPSVPGVVLQYTDLRAIIADISDARVYGGIHFRYDQVAGERQGTAVGNYIYENSLKNRGR